VAVAAVTTETVRLDGTAATPRGWRVFFDRDHKSVAKLHLWLGLAFLWVGGVMAMNMRWQLAYPHRVTPFLPFLYFRTGGVIGPAEYTSLFTLHGTVMIFFAVTPIVIGWLGNQVIPLAIGARATAFPTIGLAAWWLALLGGCLLLFGMYVPFGGPAAGWTSYPPLSSRLGAPGSAQSFMCAALICSAIGTVFTAINYLTTIIRRRAPGLTFARLPLVVWGLFLTSILNVLFAPVLAAGTLLLWSDRSVGTTFFTAGNLVSRATGDPIVYQHLFWIFGHPEVYILILPIWGVVGDLLSVFARKPAYGYRSTVFAMIGVTVLSGLVYGHHLFTTGLSPMLAQAFMSLTLLVSVPSAVFFLNWLGTLWLGSIRFRAPMVYALCVLVVFAIGGLTGMFLGTVTTDVYLHDTFFVVGHFHFVMAAAILFGAFAALTYWFPKTFGRLMNERVARWHAVLTLVLMIVTFGGMLVVGAGGMMRRLYDPSTYAYLRPHLPLNRGISHAAFALFAVQFLFIGNFLWSLFRGEKAPANPWDAATLEFTIASPPPRENFDAIPVVQRGPHEYAHPDARAGRDYLAQDEVTA
jgi:cytochrome c oxidase subunit 1